MNKQSREHMRRRRSPTIDLHPWKSDTRKSDLPGSALNWDRLRAARASWAEYMRALTLAEHEPR
jgi:hypothetical protein